LWVEKSHFVVRAGRAPAHAAQLRANSSEPPNFAKNESSTTGGQLHAYWKYQGGNEMFTDTRRRSMPRRQETGQGAGREGVMRSLLLGGALVASLGLPAAAQAQEEAQAPQASGGIVFDEIVVTANRREEAI